ncbi:peptidoglycan-binding domain-containing protein [Flavobacterium aestivum]|uniref:peptidoglycan-binding domain-containing protein n=1 Tax=Flavobacterium aestivum TaxID=3003257 RepID=UPI0024831CE7|nr:hypothetical protein [Flavobacterium aestivum]
MKLSDENKILIGVTVIGVGALGFFYWKKKQNEALDNTTDVMLESAEPSSQATNPNPQTGASLNRNLLLTKGSKGLEVRELQRLLGVPIDGDFGSITLAALVAQKGVSKISINAFSKKANVKTNVKTKSKIVAKPIAKAARKVLPKVGQKLQAIKDTSLFIAKKGANGKYFGTGDKFFSGGDLKYGDFAGTFVDVNATGNYLVKIFDGFAFVKADAVKPY